MDILLKVKYFLGLLLAAGVAALLVRAEKRQDWVTAQASLVIILLLLALMVWDWWRANHKAPPLSVHADVYYRATNRVLACVAIGFTGLVLNANRVDHWKYGVVARAIGYGALIAGAFFIAGVLLGYLFGLRPTGAPQSPSSSQSSNSSLPVTNLEEIADWLMKLILGAGLVELTRMQGPIKQLANFMARGVDPVAPADDPGSPAIALAIMGFFSASGLLYGYLWTRYQHALKDPAPPATLNSAEQPIRDRAA
jgi:4-amino-4-deoxy-L-arabinose transferase-like glycosyltransferase